MTRAGRRGFGRVAGAVAATLVFFVAVEPLLSEEEAPSGDTVAVIGKTRITRAQLDILAARRLLRVRAEEYTILRQVLDDAVARDLLETEASARGLTVSDLLRTEVTAKAEGVTEEQRSKARQENENLYRGLSPDEARRRIEASLGQQNYNERRAAFLAALSRKAGVEIRLEPPRARLAEVDAPQWGPAAAPLTVVIFSDFQCPYCARAVPVIKRLQQGYGDRLRLVFRHFPLGMHKEAPKAAEAAACAAEQGRFWEMHDALFDDPKNLGVAQLKARAQRVGLRIPEFDQCLDSDRHAATWRRDLREGTEYGVTGTPTFFVNGRFLSGALPYERFAAVLDEELAARSSSPSPKASGQTP